MEDEKVRQLAETLKKNNLAASMSEAIEKAKSILSIDTIKKPPIEYGSNPENPDLDEKDEDISLNELMKEINVEPEQVEEQEKKQLEHIRADIFKIRGGIKHAEKNPEDIEDIKKGVERVKGDMVKIMDVKSEEEFLEDIDKEGEKEAKNEEEKKAD